MPAPTARASRPSRTLPAIATWTCAGIGTTAWATAASACAGAAASKFYEVRDDLVAAVPHRPGSRDHRVRLPGPGDSAAGSDLEQVVRTGVHITVPGYFAEMNALPRALQRALPGQDHGGDRPGRPRSRFGNDAVAAKR
ncbi:hypothetical protein GCM10010191_87900 [Actinomadura vinacea]|uniref:Uncharacterized protein n=1 Tax=Actinomadura vinacea TaxID=115336 RepID=A0ABN3KFP8_9ACTN